MKKIKLVVITLISLLLITCVPVLANNNTEVFVNVSFMNGYYTDKQNIEGAIVECYSADGKTLISTSETNENGMAQFSLDKNISYIAKIVKVPERFEITSQNSNMREFYVNDDGSTYPTNVGFIVSAKPSINELKVYVEEYKSDPVSSLKDVPVRIITRNESGNLQVLTEKTNADGYASFKLKSGISYDWEIPKLPDGYRFPSDIFYSDGIFVKHIGETDFHIYLEKTDGGSSGEIPTPDPSPSPDTPPEDEKFQYQINEAPGISVIDQYGIPVMGAVVHIKVEPSDQTRYKGAEVNLTTGGNGSIFLDRNPIQADGTFSFNLVSLPEGYEMNDKIIVQRYEDNSIHADKTFVVKNNNPNKLIGESDSKTLKSNTSQTANSMTDSSKNPNTGNNTENTVIVLALLTSLLVATVSYVKVKKTN
jgi:hypothetical protein